MYIHVYVYRNVYGCVCKTWPYGIATVCTKYTRVYSVLSNKPTAA